MQAGIDAVFDPALESLLLGFYFTLLLCLSAYGAHRCYLLYLYTRNRARPTPPAQPPDDLPGVTVQLPIYNELYVVERLIDAAANLDYPAERLEIQVLDDSTDETRGIAAAGRSALAGARSEDSAARPHRADGLQGGRAGGRPACRPRGDAIAIFDADFLPPRDFLRRSIPALRQPGRRHGAGALGACEPGLFVAHARAGVAARCALRPGARRPPPRRLLLQLQRHGRRLAPDRLSRMAAGGSPIRSRRTST